MAEKLMKRAKKWSLGCGAVLLAVMMAWGAIASEGRCEVEAEVEGQSRTSCVCFDSHKRQDETEDLSHAIRGIVYDAKGYGMPGVSVELDCFQKRIVLAPGKKERRLVTVTDTQGRFSLDPATEGLFTLVVSDTQHCPVWVQNVASGASDVAVRLDRVPTIVGQVKVNHNGRSIPLAGIEVRALLEDMDCPVPISLASDRITVTDADGRFRFRGLGAQLRDGQVLRSCPPLSPTLTWRIECGTVGDCVTVRPTDREVEVKLVLVKDDHAAAGAHRLISCTHTIGSVLP